MSDGVAIILEVKATANDGKTQFWYSDKETSLSKETTRIMFWWILWITVIIILINGDIITV